MESRFCCCGVKVGAITVAYVELVVSLLLGIAACVSLGVAANICDDGSNSSETCDFIKIMLIVVISVTVVRVLLISVGAVCVHVGVKRNNPTWLLPLIIINSATIGFICFDIVSAFARGEDWLSSLGRVIDIALLIFFTYALISCSKFMNQERAMVVMGAEKTGFVSISHLNQQSPPPYSPTGTQYYFEKA